MTSFEKRKALVNQLRSAHFPFGFQNNQGAQSEYYQRFREHQAKVQQPVANGRKNNFTVTNPDNETNYQSEFKQRFPQHPLGLRDDPSKLKQTHANKNFVFGYDANTYQTNHKDDFITKGIDRPKPITQTEPHINFGGNDSLSNYTTSYNNTHDKKQGSQRQHVDPQMIRRSNMVLGNDKSNFNTVSNSTYAPKPINNQRVTKVSNFSNINLGTDGKSFSSQNKTSFVHKQVPFEAVNKQKVLDFRSAHFKLGFPQGHQYLSENKAQYEQKPIDFQKAKGNRDSSLNFNIDGNNYFHSSYKDDFLTKQNKKQGSLKNIGRIDNVYIGSDKNNQATYVTQAKSQFNDKKDKFQKSNKIKHLSQLQLGDAKGNYITHNQDTYKNKFNDRQNNRLSQAQLKQLKGVHFDTGFQNNGYGLSSANYGKGNGQANKLSKQKIASMKNTNLVSGTDNAFGNGTSYKASYLWKKSQEN